MSALDIEATQAFLEMIAGFGDDQLPHLDFSPIRERARWLIGGGGGPMPVQDKPDATRTRNSFPPCGCMDIETDSGSVHVHDAGGLLVIDINRPDKRLSAAGIVLYERGENGRSGVGFCNQMGPDAARNVAASLLRRANELDGGRLN